MVVNILCGGRSELVIPMKGWGIWRYQWLCAATKLIRAADGRWREQMSEVFGIKAHEEKKA
jgi:hypothetical protein